MLVFDETTLLSGTILNCGVVNFELGHEHFLIFLKRCKYVKLDIKRSVLESLTAWWYLFFNISKNELTVRDCNSKEEEVRKE